MLKYNLIPVLENNFVVVVYDEKLKTACVVDPGTSTEVQLFLQENHLNLEMILVTHHHDDHIAGIDALLNQYNQCKVYSSKLKNSFDFEYTAVQEGDRISFMDSHFSVVELPGHTLNHIAFYLNQQKWLFSGDVLFGLGCGRVFEGTMEQAYNSLQKIKNYPAETLVFCTHEYTKINLEFCQSHFPSLSLDQSAVIILDLVRENKPTVPLVLGNEILINPFLNAKNVQEFTQRRQLRNNW